MDKKLKTKKYKPKKPEKAKVSKQVKDNVKAGRDPFFAVVCEMYGVPFNGIDAIGSQPYLNKDGRLYLLHELRKGKIVSMKSEFIKISTTLIEPAIVKKIIVFKGGFEVEAIGEASQDSVDTDGVKKTLNMVAETRALNRVIWVAIGGEIMERVANNLAKMNINDENRARIMEAGKSSFEEMERPDKKTEQVVGEAEQNLYEATANRVDEIIDDEEKLRNALLNIDTMPFSQQSKDLIRQRIQGALDAITQSKKTTKEKKVNPRTAPEKHPNKKTGKKKKK